MCCGDAMHGEGRTFIMCSLVLCYGANDDRGLIADTATIIGWDVIGAVKRFLS